MTSAQKPADETEFDEVCERIDAALPQVRARSHANTPPTGFHPKVIKRTQQAFAEMQEDSVLTSSGEDIRITDEEIEAAAREKAEAMARRRTRSGAFRAQPPSPPPAPATS